MTGNKPDLSPPGAPGEGSDGTGDDIENGLSPLERRRHHRYRIGVLTEIESKSTGLVPGITFNISESGALILTLEPMTKGEQVNIMFLTEDGRREVMPGVIVHDEELGHHMFWKHKIGVKFSEDVPEFLKAEFTHLKRREDSEF
jgi:hypothetical protein